MYRIPKGTNIISVQMVPVVSSRIATACCGSEGSPYAESVDWIVEDEHFPVLESDISGYSWQGSRFFVMSADGDSMLPYIQHGDHVLFVAGVEVGIGDVAVISIGERLYIKDIVQMSGSGTPLRFFNERYRDLPVQFDGENAVYIVGKVLKVVSSRASRG